ncbi:DUF547 domain-containing protein, partial [Bacteriovoracaceae bacterium]|nr:DUF547 domain-containing protein [Bacteriovoracaceae bacterium]
VSSHKINFNELKNSSSKELCSAVNYLKSISIEDTTNADLFNIYNLLVIHLIVEGYDQTLKLGEQDLPQNYSVLNILDKGVKIFDEVKWNISGKLMNLNDIEYLVKQRMGDSAQLLLFRGAIGFGGLPTSPYQLSSIQNKVNENLYDVVNNKTFYDDFTSPKSFIVPGEVNHLVTDSIEKLRISVDTFRFAIFNNNIDLAVWGSVVKENELVKVEDEEYVWKLELDFSNWQLAQ